MKFSSRSARLVALLCFFGGGMGGAETKTIRLRADQWMPFNGDPAGERPGYVVELARMIFQPQGCVVDYQTMPWTDALKAAAAGEIDGVIGANSKEAAALVLPAEPIGVPRVGLFVRKSNPWEFTSVPALRTVRIGVIESYSYWDALDDYIKANAGPKVMLFKGDTPLVEAVAKLDAGEIDVLPETVPVFFWTIKTLGRAPTDYRVAYLQPSEPVFVAFAHHGTAGQDLARRFDEGLAQLRKNGRLKTLLESYSLADWKE